MQTDIHVRTIAILAVDGENYELNGCYQGQQRRAKWYNVFKSSDHEVHADHLEVFPSHADIRKLLN